MNKAILVSAALAFAFITAACSKAEAAPSSPPVASASASAAIATTAEAPVVTFIELGSVNCVPCKAMQPVMEEVRQKYGDQVSVLFYDVWTKEGEPFGQRYRIRVIPTQVFLDRDGNEYLRHEGFFAAADLIKVLEKGGVKL